MNLTDHGQNRSIQNDDNTVTVKNFKNVFESTLFTGNNIYFLAFASIGMFITAIVTIFRHRQQKHATEQKELEYLRYFHSVLPHSQIYGNLTEKFSKINRRKNSRQNPFRQSLRKKSDKVDDVSENKLNGISSIYKKFRYSQHSLRTLSRGNETDNNVENSLEETDTTDIELKETLTNGHAVSVAVNKVSEKTAKVCQKFHFDVKTENMQDVSAELQVFDNKENNVENEVALDIKEKIDKTNAQKCKTDSAIHRVHFCLENEKIKQEKEVDLITAGSGNCSGTSPQVTISVTDTERYIEKLINKSMLLEELKNMRTTEL